MINTSIHDCQHPPMATLDENGPLLRSFDSRGYNIYFSDCFQCESMFSLLKLYNAVQSTTVQLTGKKYWAFLQVASMVDRADLILTSSFVVFKIRKLDYGCMGRSSSFI